jgi:hypothetical protein
MAGLPNVCDPPERIGDCNNGPKHIVMETPKISYIRAEGKRQHEDIL